MNSEEKMNIILKARRCGFSAAMRAKLEAEIKAGKKVYFGADYAHDKDRTAEMRVITPRLNIMDRIIQKSLCGTVSFPLFRRNQNGW